MRLLPDIQGAPTLRSGSEWVVDEEGFSKMDPKLFKRRCLFWRDMSADIPV